MYITDPSAADYENIQTHRHSSVLKQPDGVRLRSLENASQAAWGNEVGGCRLQRNGFFMGLLFSLPICVLLWGIILWVLHAILF